MSIEALLGSDPPGADGGGEGGEGKYEVLLIGQAGLSNVKGKAVEMELIYF